jgi:hypothetical protein
MAESRLMTQYLKNEVVAKQKFWNPMSLLISYVIVIGITQFIAGFFDVKVSLQTPFIVIILGGIVYLYYLLLAGQQRFVDLLKNKWFVFFTLLMFGAVIWTSFNTKILPPMFQSIWPFP